MVLKDLLESCHVVICFPANTYSHLLHKFNNEANRTTQLKIVIRFRNLSNSCEETPNIYTIRNYALPIFLLISGVQYLNNSLIN